MLAPHLMQYFASGKIGELHFPHRFALVLVSSGSFGGGAKDRGEKTSESNTTSPIVATLSCPTSNSLGWPL